MADSMPPSKPGSSKAIIGLLVGGVLILVAAVVIFYTRSQPEPEPEPEKPKVDEKIEAPAPLVLATKQTTLESDADAGPLVLTAEQDTDQKKPKPKVGGTEKMGKIDGKAVNRYINTRFGQVRNCYERRLKLNPLLEGKVDLNIGVNTKGKASSITVTQDTVHDPQMITCIKGVIQSWDLPKPEGGRVIIAKQFTFKKKI